IDGWNLGTDNRETVGDFDGDGMDEVLIRSPKWAGILKYHGDRFRCDAIHNGWIGGWNLGSDNRELALDLGGDGRGEIYIRSPEWVGVIRYQRGDFALASIQHATVGGWTLRATDKESVGRFTQGVRDEILLLGENEIGVFAWDAAAGQLQLVSKQDDS